MFYISIIELWGFLLESFDGKFFLYIFFYIKLFIESFFYEIVLWKALYKKFKNIHMYNIFLFESFYVPYFPHPELLVFFSKGEGERVQQFWWIKDCLVSRLLLH